MHEINAVRCDHCRRKTYTGSGAKYRMVTHERMCWKNPDRLPLLGELYGPGFLTWKEPIGWEPDKYGVIYMGEIEGWVDVPGFDAAKGNPDCWPHTDKFTRLDDVGPDSRWSWMRHGAKVYTGPIAKDPHSEIPF